MKLADKQTIMPKTSKAKPILKRITMLLVGAVLLLSACSISQEITPTLSASTQEPPTLTSSPTASITASPTPKLTSVLVEMLFTSTLTSTPKNTSTPTPTLPSLEFSIPSPTATTTTESPWRPPAYPVPWAPTSHDHFYFSRPIAAKDVKLPFTNYRYANVFFGDHVHTGMDIPADLRESVLAAGDGKVVWAGYGLYRGGISLDDPYGISVVIKHSFGYQGQPLFTVYAHLDETIVHAGDIVAAGDEIGLVGNTGESTGPHLHFEVRVGENDFFATRNPALWLAPPQGWGVLAGQIMSSGGRLLENESVYIHSRLDVENEDEEDEVWIAKSYTMEGINSDPYYQENFVLSDLPAGYYRVNIPYIWTVFTKVIEIRPGEVTYITFEGWKGINVTEPPKPEILFTPAP